MQVPTVQHDNSSVINGGRFDFDDGGTYCGGWEDGKAHGHGVCTGPKGQGEYSGSWHFGFEVTGVYTWPSGSSYEGQWQNGKRHGLGVEARGRWIYRGEWTQGFKGRYGVRQSQTSGAKYEGTWANGLQDGYGSETYADGGTYQGQWLRGLRHGYGVRTSAPFGLASHHRSKNQHGGSISSLRSDQIGSTTVDPASERDKKIDDGRGGFVLKSKSDEPPVRRRSLAEKSTNLKKSIFQGFRLKKQRSTGDLDKRTTGPLIGSIRSTASTTSCASSESGLTNASAFTDGSNQSFVSQDGVTDSNVTETYMGEWKNDKRNGYGVSERSDGLKYEGEWYNNKKYGYGVTSFKDGTKEEGKYKNNVLITSGKKKHLFLIRSAKFREKIDTAVSSSVRVSHIALQKADIAISRTATSRGKAEHADISAMHAKEDSDIARHHAKQYAPEYPGDATLRKKIQASGNDLSSPHFLSKDEPPAHHRSRSMIVRKYGTDIIPDSAMNYQVPDGQNIMSNHTSNPNQIVPGSENVNRSDAPYPDGKSTKFLDPSSAVNQETGQMFPPNVDAFSRSPRNSMRRNKNRDDPIPEGMDDHFDQYCFDSDFSRQRNPMRLFSEPNSLVASTKPNLNQIPKQAKYSADWTPDSGVSESMDNVSDVFPNNRPGARRCTLPNLSPEDIIDMVTKGCNNNPKLGPDPEVDPGLRHRNQNNVAAQPTNSPQRTASLYTGSAAKGEAKPSAAKRKTSTASAKPKRKKSLPDIGVLSAVEKSKLMTREEVSSLSSQRREEVRRQLEEADRLRSNPLLYLLSPDVQDWFSRQQLVILVLFINVSLALLFFKLLT